MQNLFTPIRFEPDKQVNGADLNRVEDLIRSALGNLAVFIQRGQLATPNAQPIAVDSASFHFYIDEAAVAGSFNIGKLVPSSKTAITTFGAADFPYVPSRETIYSRGELLVWIVVNGITAGTYQLQVTRNTQPTSGPSNIAIDPSSPNPGLLSVGFVTGSNSPNDGYAVLVSGSTGATDTITYTAVLRLFK